MFSGAAILPISPFSHRGANRSSPQSLCLSLTVNRDGSVHAGINHRDWCNHDEIREDTGDCIRINPQSMGVGAWNDLLGQFISHDSMALRIKVTIQHEHVIPGIQEFCGVQDDHFLDKGRILAGGDFSP